MTTEQWVGLFLTLAVMAVGLAGSIVPLLPGTPLILAAAFGHRLYFGAASISNWALAALAALTILSLLFDWLASALGARKLGAGWMGMAGALLGVMAGVFFGLPGIILGPFVGAALFELFGGRNLAHSARAGVGALLGLAIASAGRFGCSVVMILLFSFSVLSRTAALHAPGAVLALR